MLLSFLLPELRTFCAFSFTPESKTKQNKTRAASPTSLYCTWCGRLFVHNQPVFQSVTCCSALCVHEACAEIHAHTEYIITTVAQHALAVLTSLWPIISVTCALISGSPQEHAVDRRQRFGTDYRGTFFLLVPLHYSGSFRSHQLRCDCTYPYHRYGKASFFAPTRFEKKVKRDR